MNCNSLGMVPRRHRWSPLARRLAFIGLALGFSTAWAQKAVTTLAGAAGSPGYNNATGTAAQFQFSTPSGAAVDSAGNIYVADSLNHAIRRITTAGVVTTFAGSLAGAAGNADGTGTNATFNNPQGIAIDGAGNLYVADTSNHTIRMITPAGVVTTLAGTAGVVGYVNDTGAAARFWAPLAVAADRTGSGGAATNVFVADTQNNAVRRIVVATRVVTTHAGALPVFAGTPGTPGNVDGVNHDARFNQPSGIVSDITGFTLYVADTGNHVLRRISSDGTNTTTTRFAGSGAAGYAEGAGTSATFNTPTGLALDASGMLLVSDTSNHVVRTVTSGGATALFAGSPTVAGAADGLALSGALFNRPTGLTVDFLGNVQVVDTINNTVRRITNAVAPTITLQPLGQTVALGTSATFTGAATGTPAPTYQWQRFRVGDSSFVSIPEGGAYTGTATPTLTISPVSIDMAGDLYQLVVTNGFATVTSTGVQLNISLGPIYTTWVGQPGVPGAVDAIGTAARFRSPTDLAFDANGTAYIADSGNSVIRKVTTGGAVSTMAGLLGVSGSADGFIDTARFNSPSSVAVDTSGNVFVADTGNHTIRMINPAGVVTTVAGLAGSIGSADGAGSAARFSFPSSIAIDSGGSLYVADTLNHTIRKITGNTVTTLAGLAGAQGAIDDTGAAARFAFPSGVAVDTSLNVYVADTANQTIRKITPAGAVTTLAGLAGVIGSADGTGNAARFNQPKGVAVDGTTLYVADTGNHTVRTVSATGEVVTVAGLAGSSGSVDGALNLARFNSPTGVAVSATVVYVADTQNHTIRRTGAGSPTEITVQPQNQNAAVGGSASFTVTATGTPPPALQWQRRAAGSSNFANLMNDATYSGATSSTLTISGVTAAMAGDEFRVLANNLVGAAVLSSTATLSVGPPPVFTSAGNATFRVGQSNTFTVTATSTPAATFTGTGLPSWASLNAVTGVLSGTPPDTSGSPFAIVITANSGTGTSTATTQNFTLTVEPAQAAPTITAPPASVTVNRGDNATFTVTANGTAPLSYQWRRNGAAISGATSATFVLPNAQATSAGAYSVTVSNAFGSVTSAPAILSVNTGPHVVAQPRTQTVLVGGSVTFSAEVTGAAGIAYQWRRNGIAIPGANSASLTLHNVSAGDAGNYDVIISNPLGSVTTSVAQLTIATGPTAPVFTLQPASTTTAVGGTVTLAAAATGVPAPTYQWRRNGGAIAGAIDSTLVLTNAQPGDAANYDVVAANASGSVTSAAVAVRVIARSYAGIYFGTFNGGLGSFAIYVREDNTGVFLGYLPGLAAPVMDLNLTVNDAGQFTFAQAAIAAANTTTADEPARAAALAPVTVNGMLGADGSVSGSIAGGVSTSLSGARISDTGATQSVAGFYQAGAANSGASAYIIASANGQAFVVAQVGATTDGGTGTVASNGQIAVTTNRSTFTGTTSATTGTIALLATGAVSGSFSGSLESVLATQRLVNISSRARVGTGDAVAIAGFVISGQESKPVLIRAVGPTLGQAPFNVPGVLTTPRLELFRGAMSIATNAGIGANRASIDAAGLQAGAFALGAAGTDAAIFTTLAPGNYTAIVRSTSTNTGVALVEVYDLSAAAAGQKLLNISTRATAGSAENTLIAGVVIAGSAPKRVLVRAVGPGLTPFGVTGVLAQPTLTLYSGAQVVATNTNWTTSADSAAIAAASAQVGAFGLAAQDSALIVTLAPGNYTAQATGPANATGVALIEVYELP